MKKTALLATGLLGCAAHMGITIVNGNNFPRSKATVYDAYRNPDLKASCHGTSPQAPKYGDFKAGDTVPGLMTYGAAHGGGHCAWMVSEDQQTWYKLNDKLDCTTAGTHDVVLPTNLPTSCGTRCTLGWFWTPALSGGCEIYHNCFDVKVTGTTGGIETAAGTVKYVPGSSPTCTRIDGTGKTPIYGTWIGPDGAGAGGGGGSVAPAPTNKPAAKPTDAGTDVGKTDLVNGCLTYTVVSGDTLDKIKANHDLNDWDILAEINSGDYPQLKTDPDNIEIGWKFRIPQTGPSVEARSCDIAESGSSALAPASAAVAALSLWAVLR